MKAQRAVSGIFAGLIAAAVLCSMKAAPATSFAEEIPETAAFSVERTGAGADGSFTARVYLDELPEMGLSAVDFAVAYDPAAVTISDVTLLYDTGADDAEAAVNPSLKGTVFTYIETEGELQVRWATALADTSYWLKEPRALFSVSGTLNPETVSPGGFAELAIVPANRAGISNPSVVAGYMDQQGNSYTCGIKLTDGGVWMPIDETGATMYGDINLDGEITISDAILLQRAVTEQAALCAAAYANADCEHDGELSIMDVTLILRVLSGYADASLLGAS